MPFPINLESLLAAGYVFLRSETCPACREPVEVFTTPGKRTIALNPMCELLRPAVRHYEVCKPKEAQDELKAGTGNIERRLGDFPQGNSGTVGGNQGIAASRNGERVAGNDVQDAQGRDSDGSPHINPELDTGKQIRRIPGDGATVLPDGGRDVGGSGIKLYGVTDPNKQLLAVGWDDGVLVCQWAKGKGQHTGVPEDLYLKLRRVPFAYRQYIATIKGKFPYEKLS